MTKDTPDLAACLEPFLANIADYRSVAKMLAALAAQEEHQVNNEVLLRVEEISEDIRSDVDRLTKLIESLGHPSATDLALTTEVDDALRLVLLEVTETGTKLYSARSELT